MKILRYIKAWVIQLAQRSVKNYVPRWVIFLIDVLLCLIAANSAYFLISTVRSSQDSLLNFNLELFSILAIQCFYFVLFQSYFGLVRYSSFKDAIKQLQVTISCVITVLIINRVDYYFFQHKLIIDAGIFIYGFIAFSLLFFFRITVKRIYEVLNSENKSLRDAYILGTSVSDVAMAEGLVSQNSSAFNITGFINIESREPKKRNRIFNLPIINLNEIRTIKNYAKSIIVSDHKLQEIQSNASSNVIATLLELKIKIYKLPKLQDWNHTDFNNLKSIKIEDLLRRKPIQLNKQKLSSTYENKTILVTGAAGSIGSEIVRQLISFRPKKIILIDQAETPLHELKVELLQEHSALKFETIIANVRDYNRLEAIFKKFLPEIIFHGAAYKHVPMMEANPVESLSVNYKGTKNTADLAVKYHAERFVFISTDKAVNPTNIMGATKRVAEVYIQSLASNIENKTTFITTRFGNVLGSNGSVIPHFKKQIENRGPVTVTHPEITRFFMTIDEACQLVLEAGAMGNGGEIFVFDMGSPIKIIDLAHHMIRLTGLTPNVDIQIEFTGLRPGEKLYEELLADKELTLPTHHEKILIAKASHHFHTSKNALLVELESFIEQNKEAEALKTLKKLVPEYVRLNETKTTQLFTKNKA